MSLAVERRVEECPGVQELVFTDLFAIQIGCSIKTCHPLYLIPALLLFSFFVFQFFFFFLLKKNPPLEHLMAITQVTIQRSANRLPSSPSISFHRDNFPSIIISTITNAGVQTNTTIRSITRWKKRKKTRNFQKNNDATLASLPTFPGKHTQNTSFLLLLLFPFAFLY